MEAAAVWYAKQSFLGVRLKYLCGWGAGGEGVEGIEFKVNKNPIL